jgi:Glycosyl hydrolases family 2, sugar binding domain/Glycosyl hydrolases family 2/Glycosyl hydrolases family 2, TIM barrel domain
VNLEKPIRHTLASSVSRRTFIAGVGSIAAVASTSPVLEALELPTPGAEPIAPSTELIAVPSEKRTDSISFLEAFAPAEGLVKPVERPFRQDLCLNGAWRFQPALLPEGFLEGRDPTPALPAAKHDPWEEEPILVPSPWNVNSFADYHGEGGDFRCYPSYPEDWEKVVMGWMRKEFTVPAEWKGRNVSLHFDAIAGNVEILVNGKSVGNHFDNFLPFDLDITAAIVFGQTNELLVGVRKASLFDKKGEYGHRPYQGGSFWGQHIVGIWQDVFLVAAPPVRVSDVYIQPNVDVDTLQVEITIQNDSDRAMEVIIGAQVFPWLTKSGKTPLAAPLPSSDLDGKAVLELPNVPLMIPAHKTARTTLRGAVKNRLKFWNLGNPNLYGLVVDVELDGEKIDRKYTRFGWRQIAFRGPQVLLNGEPLVLRGDSWHFMGIPQMTRRYPWAWFTALRNAGLNAVRLHAQPYPTFYLDVADEMGILVLDETAVWASDGGPKLDDPGFWLDTRRHLAALIQRDRNHPSVFGWSICNEVMPIIRFIWGNPPGLMNELVRNYSAWADICRKLDPTRNWISADGDEDGEGKLPVYMIHYGGVKDFQRAAATGKPWGVGETGNAYYGSPEQVAETNGERAYESFEGRMEGVAISSYRCLADEREHGASYRSVFNLVWYGLRPLPLGLKDTSKAPTPTDGIFFSKHIEGKPGVQPQRLGPYCSTLNPGYDSALPLYQPWPLFDAIRDASAEPPTEGKWSKIPEPTPRQTAPTPRLIRSAQVLAGENSNLAAELENIGVQLDRLNINDRPQFLFVDGVNLPNTSASDQIWDVLHHGGVVFVWGVNPDTLPRLNALLPAGLEVSKREASSLLPGALSSVTFGLKPSDLYFCDQQPSVITSLGLAGPLINQSIVLLKDCDTDWLLWNNQPEYAKTIMVYRSEREAKPSGVVLAEMSVGSGRLFVTTLPSSPRSLKAERIDRTVLANLGLALKEGMDSGKPLLRTGILVRALSCGFFPTRPQSDRPNVRVPELWQGNAFRTDSTMDGKKWQPVFRETGVFDITKMNLSGSEKNATSYLSFWIHSPYSLEDLLLEPNLPQVDFKVATRGSAQVWLNDRLVLSDLGLGGAAVAKALKLKAEWNHFLIKLTCSTDRGEFHGEFASNQPSFISQLDSALEKP